MEKKPYWLVLLCLLAGFCIAADAQPKPDEAQIAPPADLAGAKDLFLKALTHEQELQYDKALAHYQAALDFYRKNKQNEYAIAALNNIGVIYTARGNPDDAVKSLEEAVKIARESGNLKRAGELCHKLAIIFTKLGQIQEEKAKVHVIPPEGGHEENLSLTTPEGTFTQLKQFGDTFKAELIEITRSIDPFENKDKPYSKVFNLKVKSDYDPEGLIVPDSVEFLIQIRKTGYFGVGKRTTLLPDSDYAELSEMLVAIPRQVKPQIKDDFYKQDTIPDEITMSQIAGGKVGRPTVISDKETFKPSSYQLSVRKAGYETILQQINLPPGEGLFGLPIQMVSKPRDVIYRIQSDVVVGTIEGNLVPDEITLNGETVREGTKAKPGKYRLSVKRDGYEPIVEEFTIVPDERPYLIQKVMRALPREVIFQLTGDYSPDDLQPDEITLNNRPIKYGEAVRPDNYRVLIRKKGYDLVQDIVVVEPKGQPFLLKKSMVSTPRRIDLKVFASFPKGRLMFPQIATLSHKTITKDETFKPGQYNLYIKQPGFEIFNKGVNIAPDEAPYKIEEVLQAKPRELQVTITRDVAPESATVPTKVFLVNENTKETTDIKTGDKILPESYVLKVEQAGYEQDSSNHVIHASEDIYNIERKLTASMRPVVYNVTSEYPPRKQLVPDQITLDNQPVAKDFKIKPGHHDLVILSEGYMPIRESVEILASDQEYQLVRMLETRPRLVELVFLDAYNGSVLQPDEVLLGDNKLTPGKSQILKPGMYKLVVQLSGYAGLSEDIEVPVGVGPYKITRNLLAIQRELVPVITSDYTKGALLLDDINVFTLNDIPIHTMKDANTGKVFIKPGKYNIFVRKVGYQEVKTTVDVSPAPEAYKFEKQLESKPRVLDIAVKSSFPFAGPEGLTPNTLKLGARDVKNKDTIKPGEYALSIKHKGHKSVQEQVTIEPAETPYPLAYTLETLPRKLRYQVTSDFDQQNIEPDLINIDDKNITQDSKVIPGKYTIKIEKLGYYPKKMEVTIEPSDDDYLFTTILVSMPRDIELNITGDYPANEIIEPEVATLSGKEIRGNVFKPGKYAMSINQPGFFPLTEDLLIPPGDEVFVIERVLVSTPRTLEEEITFDVPPPDDLPPHKISLTPATDTTKESVVRPGDKIKPDEYMLRIKKEAYEPIEKKKYVWPEASPLKIKEEMKAKQVLLLINVDHDVKPPDTLKNYTVSLIDDFNIPRFVEHGSRIKPGKYKLVVERPGYSYGAPKQIHILPSEQPFHLNERLLAKQRQLSFDMVDTVTDPTKPVMVPAYKIIDAASSQEVDYKRQFRPGEKVELICKFKEYKTARTSFTIEPGEGAYRANVPMVKLDSYEVIVRHGGEIAKPPTQELDGIEYPYEFCVDGQLIEDHHILKEPGPQKWVYTISAEKGANMLQGYGGYMYAQVPLEAAKNFPRFNSISVQRLIQHLDRIIKTAGRGHRAALEIMEEGLRNSRWKRMLQAANPEEIKSLMGYLEGWSVDDALRLRLRVVLETMEKMQGE